MNTTTIDARGLMPDYYVQPHDMPLYWGDELTGELPAAVQAYYAKYLDPDAPAMTERQLHLVISYLQNNIKAPCWLDVRGSKVTLAQLREQSKRLTDRASIDAFLEACQELALDPL